MLFRVETMSMPPSLFAVIAFAGLSLISSAHAQTNRSLPSAEAILDRSVAASGGQAAYDPVRVNKNETHGMKV